MCFFDSWLFFPANWACARWGNEDGPFALFVLVAVMNMLVCVSPLTWIISSTDGFLHRPRLPLRRLRSSIRQSREEFYLHYRAGAMLRAGISEAMVASILLTTVAQRYLSDAKQSEAGLFAAEPSVFEEMSERYTRISEEILAANEGSASDRAMLQNVIESSRQARREADGRFHSTLFLVWV